MKDLRPKVLVSCGKLNFPDDIATVLRGLADVFYVAGNYDAELRDAKALVASMEEVNDSFLGKAPELGIVARFGVGYDTVDVESCTRRRVYVTYTPDVLSHAVADLTWALILSWMRRIPEADRYSRVEWGKRERGFPFGWDMAGKTLGILGLGRIGTEVAKRGTGFGIKTIYYDIIRKMDLEAGIGVKYVEFDELLRSSDILSLHVPLLPSTRGIIGVRQLDIMKPTALLVNTSRGPVIDQKALTKALKDKRIAGAAIDVFEKEPVPLGDPILSLDNVVLTSHIASATWETRRRMAARCAESVKAFLEGKRPPFIVPEQSDVSF